MTAVQPALASCTHAYTCGHTWRDTCLDCGQCAGHGCTCHCALGFTPGETPADGPEFWLGAHHARWLATAGVPLCVSRRTLTGRRSLPRAAVPWVLDSGGFTELSLHGEWTVPAWQYAAEIRRFRDETGLLAWAAPQDWMCEPWMLAKTGLTVAEHQARTVGNLLDLRAEGEGDLPVIPVLQGWVLADYESCVDRYEKAGIDLAAEPLVGLGSVCRRQSGAEAAAIVTALAGRGIRLHGFGFKLDGLRAAAGRLASADSMAWSLDARRSPPLPDHTHRSCANCLAFALRWRERVLAALRAPRQLALDLHAA